jgi:hypothetical protein
MVEEVAMVEIGDRMGEKLTEAEPGVALVLRLVEMVRTHILTIIMVEMSEVQLTSK